MNKISTSQAQSSLKALQTEAFDLSPSALITLFEIDLSELVTNQIFDDEILSENQIFRFHNNVKLFPSEIYWDSNKDGVEQKFIAAPIASDGWETTTKGTIERPKLAISVSDENIPNLAILKDNIRKLGDLTGAKVTRIRTLASALPARNWEKLPAQPSWSTPDANREFGRDQYYIDRRSFENKSVIEFELASLLDVEGTKLPGRLCLANRCVAQYRGYGCFYEYRINRNSVIHGEESTSMLPVQAPAVANDKDESILEILSTVGIKSITYRGVWQKDDDYLIGHSAHIEVNGLKYHFVALVANKGIRPPNSSYWIQDQCSHTVNGCKARYGINGSVIGSPFGGKGNLPMMAFPGCDKVR